MRTPAKQVIYAKLSDINRHLTCMLFVAEEFNNAAAGYLEANVGKSVTQVFPENKYNNKFDIKVENIKGNVDDYFQYVRDSFVVYVSECVKEYFSLIIEIGGKVNDRKLIKTSNEEFYPSVAALFGCTTNELIPDMMLHTLQYFRMRRNCIVHKNAEANKALLSHIRNYGTHLNRYWEKLDKRTILQFNSDNISAITDTEVIETINICRVCIRHIDEQICTRLDMSGLERYLRDRFSSIPAKYSDAKTTERKFRSFCRLEFDVNFT